MPAAPTPPPATRPPPATLPPRPALLAGGGGEDSADGLILAVLVGEDGRCRRLGLAELDLALAERRDGDIVWVHLNASAGRAKLWLQGCRQLPEPVREDLLETDERTRLEPLRDGVLGVIGDVAAGADPDPWRLATLRFYLGRHLVVSTRRRPVVCASRLGRALQDGLAPRSSAEIVVGLLNHAADGVQARTRELAIETDRAEDDLLADHVAAARQKLGRTRRRAARLRRQVALRPRAIDRLRARLPGWLGEDDRYELLDALDRMETLVDELVAIEQREAALAAEVASKLADETNRNLYLLSVVTVLFAPMTLVTGIFGMNVAGMPGLHDPDAFLWVMAVMLAIAALGVLALYWRRLF